MQNYSIEKLDATLARLRQVRKDIDSTPGLANSEREQFQESARNMSDKVRSLLCDLQWADHESRRDYIYAAAERIAEAANPSLIQQAQSGIRALRTAPTGFEGDSE